MRRRGRTHLVIPDCQVKPGVNTDHLEWIGRYIAEKRPNVVVCIGDFADMPSLSSYDKGKKCFEGRRYKLDIEAAKAGMERLMAPIRRVKGYRPQLVMTLGNHEERILRAIEADAVLDGTVGIEDLGYAKIGWRVHDFLEVVEIDGVEYSHYFCSGVMGRPVSSARVLLNTRQGSAIQGHVQKFDMAVHERTGAIAIMVGIAYTHQEDYLTPQGQSCRQQIVMLHEVVDGSFDPMFVSISYLRRKYSRTR
jgi:hypothetical protein